MKLRTQLVISLLSIIVILSTSPVVHSNWLDPGGGNDAPTHVNVTFDFYEIWLYEDGDLCSPGDIYFRITGPSGFYEEITVGEYSDPNPYDGCEQYQIDLNPLIDNNNYLYSVSNPPIWYIMMYDEDSGDDTLLHKEKVWVGVGSFGTYNDYGVYSCGEWIWQPVYGTYTKWSHHYYGETFTVYFENPWGSGGDDVCMNRIYYDITLYYYKT